MCVLFSLGDSGLLHVVCCKPFTKGIGNRNLMESNQLIRDRRIIVREAYISKLKSLRSVKSLEVIITKCSGNFSCTVRTEVKEDYGILVLDGCNRLSILYYNGRLYKFIGLFTVIGSLDTFCGTCRSKTFAPG